MSTLIKFLALQVMFLWQTIPSAVEANYRMAKSRCNDSCGDVWIPYPFGIGSGCPLNDWYSIFCNYSSNPPKPYLSNLNLEVLRVSLDSQTIIINSPVSQFCRTENNKFGTNAVVNSSDLSGSPFFFSKTLNKLMLFGCGNALLIDEEKRLLSGCSSICELGNIQTNSCYGIDCCQTSIPFDLSEYHLNLTSSSYNDLRLCASAFLVAQNWFPERFSDPFVQGSLRSIPVVLIWTLRKSDVDSISGCKPHYLELDSGTETWYCTCENSYLDPLINPYLDDQCSTEHRYGDFTMAGKAIAYVAVTTGVLLLVAVIFVSFKFLVKERKKRIKEKFFKRNGGLLLQKQLSSDDSLIEKITIFTARELDKATHKFNESRILGRGAQGTVYKGMLADGRIVAIKKSELVDESRREQFINEVVLLSQVVHENIVKLLGCCLETEVPLLVYEFIPNGTLFDLIHNGDIEFLTWNMRLRIATEVAEALSYLHSAIIVPIYHRDIKSSNILLDEKYVAKVSDFGTSLFLAISKTHITTLVRGTFGYLDPEYFQSSQFTEKSDVYSFGVVLVELLTRQTVIPFVGMGEDDNLSLAGRFLKSMEENRLGTILDNHVLDHNNKKQVIAAAKLSQRCLNLNRKNRPSMKDVATELERIRTSGTHQSIEESFQGLECIEEELALFSNASPAWTEDK